MELLPYESLMRKLREKRRSLNVTQRQVASEAGVSPSQLSRMENGNAEAKYRTVHAVWESLRRHERAAQETAATLCSPDVAWAAADESVRAAWLRMRENHFSQLPVRDDAGRHVGGVTERSFVDADKTAPVREVMDSRFVEVSSTTARETLAALLRDETPAVLVRDGDEYNGIVTTADLV